MDKRDADSTTRTSAQEFKYIERKYVTGVSEATEETYQKFLNYFESLIKLMLFHQKMKTFVWMYNTLGLD